MRDQFKRFTSKVSIDKATFIAGSLFTVIAISWFILFFIPSVSTIRQNEDRISRIELKQSNALHFEEKVAKSRAIIKIYKSIVRNNITVSNILLAINKAVKDSGVNLIEMHPLQESHVNMYGIAYSVIPIKVSVISTFRKTMKLIKKIVSINGFYNISSIKFLNPVFIPPDTVNLDVSFEVDVYFVKRGKK